MSVLIFIAPPAAGKGTQAKIICSKYGYEHISTGDLIRNVAHEDTDLGKQVEEVVSKGELVDDAILLEMIEEVISNDPRANYLFDGFPRTLNQAVEFDKILNKHDISINKVIYIHLDKDDSKKRILGRVSCPKCGRIYNKYVDCQTPKNELLCDDCNVKLIKRSDDNEVSFNKRYSVYLSETVPVLEYYRNKKFFYQVNGNRHPDDVTKQIEEVLNDNH